MNSISKGLFWKLMERFGVQGMNFVIQIVLARLLDPEHYGVLSIMVVFTALASVFVETGFSVALIQNKDVNEEDYSSVFWVSLGITGFMYIVIFLCAPVIAAFYEMPTIVLPLRALALMLFPGAMNCVQSSKVSREMDFKKDFYSSIIGTLIAGLVGMLIAFMGGGLWALVVQNILNISVACIVMLITVDWRPRLVCDVSRVIVLFRFGWKLLASSLLDTLYSDLSSLVIGKRYDGGTLGYYDRGKQFPQFVINAIDSSVQSVMLPAMAAKQDDKEQVKTLMRNSITISAYIIFPMMAGLAVVAPSLVEFLLTDKWLPCVPYLQIYCFSLAFYPVHTSNLQAINAVGRSDLFLKLEIIKKTYGILLLVIAVFCFDSPIAIAMTGAISGVISSFVNASPNKRLIGYSYLEQMKDILPSFTLALLMCAGTYIVGNACSGAGVSVLVTLVVQVVAGVVQYVILSLIVRPKAFVELLKIIERIAENKMSHSS